MTEKKSKPKNKIYCFRDAVINTEARSPTPGVNEDETPRGKRYKIKGGIVTRVVLAVDLYFIVPNKLGYYAIMLKIQDHFQREITKWNEGVLQYEKRELSEASLDETFYKSRLAKLFGEDKKAFAFEISDILDDVKMFRYHGYYVAGAWRNKDGSNIGRPALPGDWNIGELNYLADMLTR
jgi:hypothetical protein